MSLSADIEAFLIYLEESVTVCLHGIIFLIAGVSLFVISHLLKNVDAT